MFSFSREDENKNLDTEVTQGKDINNMNNVECIDSVLDASHEVPNNVANPSTCDPVKSHMDLNSRETTFQKLRERIMMNKLQKSNSSENSNPIRPSLYRKYPKRKGSRDRAHVFPVQFKETKNIVQNDNANIAPVIPQVDTSQRKVEPEDYQRYYLQPMTVPFGIPIKVEPDEKEPLVAANDLITASEPAVSERGHNIVHTNMSDAKIEHKGAKRNLESEFDEETSKKSTDEERIWLRALKEEGMKEVKRNENIAGISQQYQNEYYKFIEGKDFSKEAKEVFTYNNQLEKNDKIPEKDIDKRDKKGEDIQTTTKEAFELTDFCSSLMARHPLYLQPCEEQGANATPGNQVMLVPKLVPYPEITDKVTTQSQNLGQLGPVVQGQNFSAQPMLPTPLLSPNHSLPMTNATMIHPMGLPAYPTPSVQVTEHDEAEENTECNQEQSGSSSHNSRRKQNAPKRRKPKDDEIDHSTPGKQTDKKIEQSPEQAVASLQAPSTISQITVPEIPSGAPPSASKDVTYAYIAIPVSAFVPGGQLPQGNQASPIVNHQPVVIPPQVYPGNVSSGAIQENQSQVQTQALDFSSRSRSEREPGEISPRSNQVQGQSRWQKPVQPVQPLPVRSVPVNPFIQNNRPAENSHGRSLPSQVQRLGQQRAVQHENYQGQLSTSFYRPQVHGIHSGLPTQTLKGVESGNQSHPSCRQFQNNVQIRNTTEKAPQRLVTSVSSPPNKKIKFNHPIANPPQFSHFACLQRNTQQEKGVFRRQSVPHSKNAFNQIAKNYQGFNTFDPAGVAPNQQIFDAQQFNHTSARMPMFAPMQLPVRTEHAQAYSQTRVESRQQQNPEHNNVQSVPNGERRSRKQSQFIDLTDDADDVEDVYSPGDDEVPISQNNQQKHHKNVPQIPQTMPPSDDAQAIQEEQIKLMDNVSKLAELHSEVGALINESTQILDTLAPTSGNDENEAKKAKKKKGKTGRKLIKYDAKGRRIFKFHEYCPR